MSEQEVSEENDKFIEYDSEGNVIIPEYECNMKELDGYMIAAESAIKDIDTLCKIASIVKSNKESVLSIESISLINIQLNYCSPLLSADGITKYSLESNNDNNKEVAIETLNETINTIWKNISNTLSYILEKISAFLKEMYKMFLARIRSSENDVKEIKLLTKEIDNIKDPEISNSLSAITSTKITSDKFLKPLAYMNKTIVDNDIFTNIDKLQGIGMELEAFTKVIEQNISILSRHIKAVNSKQDFTSFYEAYSKEIESIDLKLNMIVLANRSKTPITGDDIDIILNSIPDIKEDNLDVNSIFKITGFINGGVIYFFKLIDTGYIGHQSLAIDKVIINDNKVDFEYLSFDSIGVGYDKLIELEKIYADSSSTSEKIYNNSIKVKHKEIINKITKLLSDKNSDNTDEFVKEFRRTKDIAKAYIRLIMETHKGYGMLVESEIYYKDLLKFCVDKYKKELTKQ